MHAAAARAGALQHALLSLHLHLLLPSLHLLLLLLHTPCTPIHAAAVREEEVYELEAVLGRDAASVFPSMSKSLDPMEQLKATVGAKRFVTETEVRQREQAEARGRMQGCRGRAKCRAPCCFEQQ